MTIIGTFIRTGKDEYVGELVSFTIRRESVRIVPATDRTGDNAPTHLLMAGDIEVAQGWAKRTQNERDYISFRIDDPGFVAPIYPALWDRGDGRSFDLDWKRPKKRQAD